MMQKSSALDEIGLHYGTDKASTHHNYLEFYELFFSPMRDASIRILEIGVLNGASLKTWEKYFLNAQIIGADISPKSKQFERGRIKIELLDQSNIEEITAVAIKHGPFDIIIEDGSHLWDHQIISLRTLFPFLNDGGIYIVEDLQTNYGDEKESFRGLANSTCVDFLKAWLDLRVADEQIALSSIEDPFLRTYGRSAGFMTFYRRACLIRKQLSFRVRNKSPGSSLLSGDSSDTRGLLLPLTVLAHLSYEGDVVGPQGFVNLSSDKYTIQGISVALDDYREILDYRVRYFDGNWSEWRPTNTPLDQHFLGTRGRSECLIGFSVRLNNEARNSCTVHAIGRFVGLEDPVEVSDNEDCMSPNQEALCGIEIRVYSA